MQTSHLCCPSSSSSSTSQYASSYITQFIHSILNSAGFSKSSSQAIELLTEVFERYLLLLASTSKQHSDHVGRLSATPWDVEVALNDLGSSTDDIQRWFDEEGGDVAGRWLSGWEGGQEGDEERGEAQWLGIPTASLLGERQSIGKAPPSESRTFMHYEEVDEAHRTELEALFEADEEAKGSDESDEGGTLVLSENGTGWAAGQSPPPPYRSTSSAEPPLIDPPTYKKRKMGETFVDFIPAFLPMLPGSEEGEGTTERTLESDAEHERERGKRMQMGEERKELFNDDGVSQKTKEEKEEMVLAAHDTAPSSKRSTEDSWHSSVDFPSSILAQQQSIDDIPADRVEEEEDHDAEARQSQSSSQRIFANDYLALVSEANSVPPTMLTPTGSAFVNAFNLRRALASHLSDPSRYIPCDTIFGAIDARPSAAPFQPGPSLLITPPTTTNSAPTFTPIQAGGRELISTSTMNNSLHPVCAHRKPNSILNASRYLSGGQQSEMFRRITRTLDPIPILDERHAERVFHGAQASKDLLHDDNSFLREALDVLKMKRADEVKAGLGNGSLEEQQSQLSMSANRDKIRVKSGTLVQTWDWMARDYTDPVLPGKKYRTGTTGVTVSGNTDSDQQQVDRGRSESVQIA